jgi:L-lactate permease
MIEHIECPARNCRYLLSFLNMGKFFMSATFVEFCLGPMSAFLPGLLYVPLAGFENTLALNHCLIFAAVERSFGRIGFPLSSAPCCGVPLNATSEPVTRLR